MATEGRELGARRLVCCFDGTGNEFGEVNSNVVELFRVLDKKNPDKQLVYYQTGIGTYTSPLIRTPLVSWLASTADEGVAWYLHQHVKDGYRFLMDTYRPGDKICLFGFSRGAYTARALAGMLHKVGLLPPHNQEQLDFAFNLFKRTDMTGWKLSKEFRKTFTAHDVTIEFVGVWDTVASVGIIPSQLPFTASNYSIKTFRQALSLDERRANFLPNTWNTPTSREAALGFQPTSKERPKDVSKDDWEFGPPVEDATDVYEVWFSGCHADVGGGSVSDFVRLARISLAWMIKECVKTNSGILFNDESIKELGINPKDFTLIPGGAAEEKSDELIAVEGHKTYIDAPIYDQLAARPFWWALEFIPLIHSFYHEGYKKRYISRNRGRGRYIWKTSEGDINVHISVKERLEKLADKYLPKVDNFHDVKDSFRYVD